MSLSRAPFEGERKMLAAIRARLADIPDDELADAAQLAGEMSEFYGQFNKDCQHELLARMAEQGRQILVTDTWRCEREATPAYEWDGERANAVVRSVVGPTEAERYVKHEPPKPVEPTWKVNTQQMKALMGKVSDVEREALEACYTRHEKNPKVKFTRIGGTE